MKSEYTLIKNDAGPFSSFSSTIIHVDTKYDGCTHAYRISGTPRIEFNEFPLDFCGICKRIIRKLFITIVIKIQTVFIRFQLFTYLKNNAHNIVIYVPTKYAIDFLRGYLFALYKYIWETKLFSFFHSCIFFPDENRWFWRNIYLGHIIIFTISTASGLLDKLNDIKFVYLLFFFNQMFIHIYGVFHFLTPKNMSKVSERVNEVQKVNCQDQKMSHSRSTAVKKYVYTINLT